MSSENAAKLRDSLASFLVNARKTGGRSAPSPSPASPQRRRLRPAGNVARPFGIGPGNRGAGFRSSRHSGRGCRILREPELSFARCWGLGARCLLG
ncbi:hypothetical protein [Saccharopolyspora hattusasensis]|uniref:hypothetical protein n=1 Tax=Saccharopolyspora hattusasensis TaxID=1128679 RepID=UPI003D99AE83